MPGTTALHFKNPGQIEIEIIGLGHIGHPLAAAFVEQCPVVGFDINQKRMDVLMRLRDRTQVDLKHRLTDLDIVAQLVGCHRN